MVVHEDGRSSSGKAGQGGKRFALVGGLSALLGGSLVLIGWRLDAAWLGRIRDARPGAALFVLGNIVCLVVLWRSAMMSVRRSQAREREASRALLVREARRVHEEDAMARLERTAETERLSRLSAEDALREKEDQLRQAQKLEAIGSLAGGVAHDFNNLLTVVLSYADILAVGLTPEDPMWEGLDEIRQAGERAADLTKQLLAFSRKQVLTPTVLDLDHVVEGMLKMLRRLIGASVELSHLSTGDLGKVHLDRGQTEQVLLNLVVNARDAMPQGGKITIRTSNTDVDVNLAEELGVAPGPHVLLTVEDTGTGMDTSTKAHIFEPFYTTKEKGKGTGLGLAVVFGIVKQSGGHVAVCSVPGKGTTFSIHFPRTTASLRPRPRAEPARHAHRGTETILLVEDEDQIRHLAAAILRKSGYHVLDSATGGDALLISEQHEGPIHLLLADVVMPRLSGDRLSGRLAALRPKMKVLYMSGGSDEAIPRRGVDGSPVAFLPKPLTPDSLLRKIREVLDGTEKLPDPGELKRRRESAEWRERRRSKTHTPTSVVRKTPCDAPDA